MCINDTHTHHAITLQYKIIFIKCRRMTTSCNLHNTWCKRNLNLIGLIEVYMSVCICMCVCLIRIMYASSLLSHKRKDDQIKIFTRPLNLCSKWHPHTHRMERWDEIATSDCICCFEGNILLVVVVYIKLRWVIYSAFIPSQFSFFDIILQ